MRGYSGIELTSSACVRFVRNDEIDGSEREIFDEARRRAIRCVYIDSSLAEAAGTTLANQIAVALGLDNAPYETRHWLCLLDDLITLAHREQGLVVVVDGAWTLIDRHRNELFDLIEVFLTQLRHWLEEGKPCYLCLQMEINANVATFVRHASRE
jgi:hypothetical protein